MIRKGRKERSRLQRPNVNSTGNARPAKSFPPDEAGTVEISNPTAIKATGHNLKKAEEKDATATEEEETAHTGSAINVISILVMQKRN